MNTVSCGNSVHCWSVATILHHIQNIKEYIYKGRCLMLARAIFQTFTFGNKVSVPLDDRFNDNSCHVIKPKACHHKNTIAWFVTSLAESVANE